MPGCKPGRSRRLITVIAAVAAAGAVTGVNVPPAMAATPTARTLAAIATADQLDGVACPSARDCMGVGSDTLVTTPVVDSTHTPLAERWNGTRWRAVSVKLPSGATGGLLLAVACPAATQCFAVGDVIKGSTWAALAETWNGKAWTPALPPAPADSIFEAVSCLSPKSCLAVGVVGSGTPVAPIGLLLIDSWNGSRWTRVNVSALAHTPGGFLDGVSCASASFCIATGAVFSGSNGAESALIEGWNGKDWAAMKPATPRSSSETSLSAVSCASPTNCVTVGSGFSITLGPIGYAEAWNGRTWALTHTVPWPKGTTGPRLSGVSCSTAGHCVAVGAIDLSPAANGSLTGRAAAATWNGKDWTPSTIAAPGKDDASAFAAVSCRPGKTVFCAAVGEVGTRNSAMSSTLSGFWNGKRWKVVLPVH